MRSVKFDTDMVQAILSGRKSVMRWLDGFFPGDILYVKERWAKLPTYGYVYYADNENWDAVDVCWQSPSRMPREAARIFLKVTNVHTEYLQDMTEDDVVAEGAEPLIQCPIEHPMINSDGTTGDMCWNTNCCKSCEYVEKSYPELFGEKVWNPAVKRAGIDLHHSWEANPWVYVVEFKRISREEALGK